MPGLIDHVTMRVADLERSLEWYTTHFEYEDKERRETESATSVFLGPAEIHSDGSLIKLVSDRDRESYRVGDSWGHLSVRVRDAYEAYADLVAAGVEGHQGPDETPGRYTFVKDPDGYVIELSERDHGALWSLDHVMIRTDDPTLAIGWYTHVLEYDLYWRAERDEYALYNLELDGAPQEAASIQLGDEYDGPFTMGDAWGHLAIRSGDVHDDWASLLYRGAENYRDPASCDGRHGLTRDPEGHEIKLVEPDSRVELESDDCR
jgi:lactoylglutathione lyase